MLVDTHVLLWLLDDDARLGAHARRLLDEAHRVKVSTASLWELAIKRQLGKLAAPDDLPARIESAGLEWLVVSHSTRGRHRTLSGCRIVTPSIACSSPRPRGSRSPSSPPTE